MPLENWVQHSRVDQFLYDWQTLLGGLLAFAAGFGTVVATMIIAYFQIKTARVTASEQIKASREQADKMVDAAQDQISQTYLLATRRRDAEAEAFRSMLEAAMARVLAEAASGRRALMSAVDTLAVRECITKGAFAELRAACVRQGSPLTGEFLDLEREIDNFSSQSELVMSPVTTQLIRKGMREGLEDQLAVIEAKATELKLKAAPPEQSGLETIFG